MKRLILAVAVALIACGASPQPPPPLVVIPPPPPPPPVDAAVDAAPSEPAVALARMTELADAMCRCPDSACANRIAEDTQRWSQRAAAAGDDAGDDATSDADAHQLAEITERLVKCMTDAMSRPATAAP